LEQNVLTLPLESFWW